jgi:hypothetical protein
MNKIKYKIVLALFINLMPIISVTAQVQPENISAYFKHEIGLQFNPYINPSNWGSTTKGYISTLSYRYYPNKYFAFGPEVFGAFFTNSSYTQYRSSIVQIGAIARYTYHNDFWLHPFVEGFIGGQVKSIHNITYNSTSDTSFRQSSFHYFVAPGIKVLLPNRHFSFDLMYKFSSYYFVNNKHAVFSWRFCYAF